MTDQLTTAGLEIDDLVTRKSAMKASIRSACGANLDLSPDQPDGQFVEIFAERVQAALEILQEVYAGLDRDEASDDALTSLCSLTGTNRRASTYGTTTLTLTLAATITVSAGSVAHVLGDPTNRWETLVAVTSTTAGNYTVAATNTQKGAIQALAGSISVIATPVAGWTVVTNAADAVEGLETETDTELRLRAEQELALGGSTTVDAIQADLIDWMVAQGSTAYARVYENATDSYDSAGRPPHSFEAVVRAVPSLSSADIAEQIWLTKAAGIQAWGTTISSYTDNQGESHEVRFTLAAPLVLKAYIVLTEDTTTYPGDTTLKVALIAHIDTLTVGDDVILSQLVATCFEVTGVEDVVVTICWSGGSPAAANLTVGVAEIATLISGNVTIT
jgi:uncharacterized phage protein gp47/JayE